MEVIPVLDLKGGRAVHARGGDRERYAIVQGVFGGGADPAALAGCMLRTLGCESLYVADLDAIAGIPSGPPAIRDLARLGARLLVDVGARDPAGAEAVLAAGADQVVIGLETLAGLPDLAAIVAAVGAQCVTFSLDLRNGRPLTRLPELARAGAVEIARLAAGHGVEQILCLDLARVGSAAGLERSTVAALREHLPGVRLLVGGGVRSVGDLEQLAALGCSGVLVATALHTGDLRRIDLDRFRHAPPRPASAP